MDNKRYYTTRELAERLGLSVKWVEKWRPWIVGALRFGRSWRFDKDIVEKRLAKGQELAITADLTSPPRRKYILSVHGAARSGKEGS